MHPTYCDIFCPAQRVWLWLSLRQIHGCLLLYWSYRRFGFWVHGRLSLRIIEDEPCELGEPASGAGMEKRHSLVSNFKQFGFKWYLCKIRIRFSITSLYQFLVQWLHVNRLSGNEKTTFGRFMSLLGIIEGPIYLRVIISEIGRKVMGCRLGGILWKWRKEEERCPAA